MSAATPRVVVDPITRIEGHLRIEAATDAEGRITEAYSAGTMVRGIEIILRGRDPRDAWAFAQRICGVCTLVHGIASVRAVEDALHYEIPPNANLVRNLMIGAQYVHDHVMHFYHLHALDWVDVVSALSADPAATSTLAQSLSGYARILAGYFADVQKRVKTLVESGQLGIFAGAYWGHPAYKLPPEANLMAVAHYLDALAWQRDVATLHAIFGGKNPHPHFVVGGAPNPIDLESDSAINAKRLSQVQDIIVRMRQFVDEVYLPDTLAIAGFYKDWATQGEGLGNFLCFGDFPAKSIFDTASFMVPRGAILGRDLSHIEPVDLADPAQIQEFVSHAWYDYAAGNEQGLHPYDGETKLNYTGPQAAVHAARRRAGVLLAQVTTLARQGDGGRAAGAHADAGARRATRRPRNWSTTRSRRWTCRSRRCTRRSAAPRRAPSRPRSSPMPCRAGTTSWWRTSRRATRGLSTTNSGSPAPGRRTRAAQASWRRRAARSATGSSSSTARSPTTRRWCRAPGMPARATRPARRAPTRRRSPGTGCTTRHSRSRSCAPSTASTRASPVRCTLPGPAGSASAYA